ncbi:MAG TPA: hypothetical protein VGO78_02460, partial [Acidimicrobiales bacterium]|nr:hypothetical protein [Acidimicrobiales bacterium]
MSGGVLLVPNVSDARPLQENDPASGGEESGQSAATVHVDIDVEKANSVDVEQAFSSIRDNVEAQRAALDVAQAAVTAADAEVTLAQARVDQTQAEIDAMVGLSDDVVVRAYVNPPIESAIQTLTADSPTEATVKKALLDMQADADAGVIAEYQAKQDELKAEKEAQQEATDAADARRADADAALADQDPVGAADVGQGLEALAPVQAAHAAGVRAGGGPQVHRAVGDEGLVDPAVAGRRDVR